MRNSQLRATKNVNNYSHVPKYKWKMATKIKKE